jgi:hypothetical protein
MKALSNALRRDGILISQLGENFQFHNPGLHYSVKRIEYEFMQNLIEYGFDRMEDYTEAHGGFSAEWKYKILFKCGECHHSRWHRNQAMVELDIKKRSMKCINDCNLFRFFDGATMMGYQYVSRVNEAVFCRDVPQNLPDRQELWCENRHGYDPEVQHFQTKALPNHFNLSDGKVEDFPFYVGLDMLTQNIVIPPMTTNLVQIVTNASSSTPIHQLKPQLWNVILENYCTPEPYLGSSMCFVSLRLILLAANHFINGTVPWTVGNHSDVRRAEFQKIMSPFKSNIYNPYVSRNHITLQWITDMMLMTTSHTKQGDGVIGTEYDVPVEFG